MTITAAALKQYAVDFGYWDDEQDGTPGAADWRRFLTLYQAFELPEPLTPVTFNPMNNTNKENNHENCLG